MKKMLVIFGLVLGISLFLPKVGNCKTGVQKKTGQSETAAIADKVVSEEVERKFRAKESKRGIARELIFENLSQEEKNALAQLRKKDPEKFKEILKQKLKERREVLKKLKEENPEEFKKVMSRTRERIRQRMTKLKEEDPEKFKQLMQKRARMKKQRVKKLCRDDPEKCREILQKRKENFKKKLEELKEIDPERYAEIKKCLKRRREKRKDYKSCPEGKSKQGPDSDKDKPGKKDVNP